MALLKYISNLSLHWSTHRIFCRIHTYFLVDKGAWMESNLICTHARTEYCDQLQPLNSTTRWRHWQQHWNCAELKVMQCGTNTNDQQNTKAVPASLRSDLWQITTFYLANLYNPVLLTLILSFVWLTTIRLNDYTTNVLIEPSYCLSSFILPSYWETERQREREGGRQRQREGGREGEREREGGDEECREEEEQVLIRQKAQRAEPVHLLVLHRGLLPPPGRGGHGQLRCYAPLVRRL